MMLGLFTTLTGTLEMFLELETAVTTMTMLRHCASLSGDLLCGHQF